MMGSDSFRVHKIRFRPGLRPDLAGGALYTAPPDLLVGLAVHTFKGREGNFTQISGSSNDN